MTFVYNLDDAGKTAPWERQNFQSEEAIHEQYGDLVCKPGKHNYRKLRRQFTKFEDTPEQCRNCWVIRKPKQKEDES